MENFRSLKIKIVIGTILLLPLSVGVLLLSFLSHYADAINLSAAFLLFPFAMIWTKFNGNNLDGILFLLAFIQFPIYAAILSLTKSKKMLFLTLFIIFVCHFLAIFLFAFSPA